MTEAYFPGGFSRLPSPEASDLEELFVNFCSIKNDNRGGVYFLFGAEKMETGYYSGPEVELVT
jgi:hypothetical protein